MQFYISENANFYIFVIQKNANHVISMIHLLFIAEELLWWFTTLWKDDKKKVLLGPDGNVILPLGFDLRWVFMILPCVSLHAHAICGHKRMGNCCHSWTLDIAKSGKICRIGKAWKKFRWKGNGLTERFPTLVFKPATILAQSSLSITPARIPAEGYKHLNFLSLFLHFVLLSIIWKKVFYLSFKYFPQCSGVLVLFFWLDFF